MPNQSEIENAKYLLRMEGYSVEKRKITTIVNLTMDEKDDCLYHLVTRNPLTGQDAYDIIDAIDKVLKNNNKEELNGTDYKKAIQKLFEESLNRMNNINKDFRDRVSEIDLRYLNERHNK